LLLFSRHAQLTVVSLIYRRVRRNFAFDRETTVFFTVKSYIDNFAKYYNLLLFLQSSHPPHRFALTHFIVFVIFNSIRVTRNRARQNGAQ